MARPKTINEYLASVPTTHRAALKQLNGQIKKLYPKATEHIAYQVPLFKLDGHPLLSFRASKNHSSIFPWSSTVLKPIAKMLKGYSTGKGTVRFAPNKPLPLKIVKAVLKEREKEIKARFASKKKSR